MDRDRTENLGAWGICDESGFEFRLRDLRKRWDGMMVGPQFWEPQQPQDFVTSVRESVLPYTRPEAPDVFITVPVLPSDL